jgi:nuclear pore complex protein Nup98-Nup96
MDAEYLEAVFSLVSGRQIAAACSLANQHRDHKLALLLSQIASGTPNSRMLAYEQMDVWRRMGIQHYITKGRLRLFALLAGLMVWECDGEERGGGEDVRVCHGLDWKRVLGLHLWYCSSPTSRVAEAVAQFTRAFMDETAYALPPIPAYMEKAGFTPPTSGSYDDNLTLDSCFHVLRLYCARDHSLERTLNPAASIPFHLDYRISWHLWSVLHSLYLTHLHPSSLSHLHQSFAAQLEAVGLWHWAVFILLHLPLSAVREVVVRGVLGRWCSGEEAMTEEEEFVVERLRVPEQWVYSAKAGRACYDGNFRQQAAHLLQAHQWDHAHSVIIDHLATDDIISGDTSSLHHMLSVLSDPSCSSDIHNWENAGSGYFDYLQISSRLQRMAQDSEAVGSYELEELLAGLTRLAHRVRHLPARNPREILCQAEIAKRTATFTRVVCDLKQDLIGGDSMTEPHSSREISHTLLPLPLPSDATISEFRQLIQPHIQELVI